MDLKAWKDNVYVVASLLGLLVWVVWRASSSPRSDGGGLVPNPSRFPLGLDIIYRIVQRMRESTFLEYTHEILDETPGRTASLEIMGKRLVLTDRQENITAVMLTQFSHFGKGHTVHEVFKNVLGDSVFATDGHAWMRSKDQLRPHAARIRSDDLAVTEFHVQRLFRHLRGSPDGLEVFDVIDRLQLDIVTEIFLGTSTDSLEHETSPFRDAMETLLKVNTRRIPLGHLAPLLPDWLLAPASSRKVERYIGGLIDKTLAMGNEELKLKDPATRTLMEELAVEQPDRKFVKDQLVSVLLASKDPVTILTVWTIYELSRRPELVQKMQDEIEEHIGIDTIPDMDGLKKLTLLQNVIKETMRMYHPLGLNVREALQDTTLPVGSGADGAVKVAVSKGDIILYSVHGLQRNTSIVGPDADVWDPSRWERWAPKSGQFLPFNMGPRICLGRNFGQLEIQYVLVRILQEFETISWCGYGGKPELDKEPMRIKVELNTKFASPVLCKFVSRK
ncbi:cytochrome P450 [Colletotrichum zoysiae]|uniref:Cytochrome P450 n=1 Tax=Colletotrichum zoysiae TaxID=1216348 RepID=A0AAD9HEX3_9PEZI|nr:cytochrome P450 [Colletotrichum zoysiae]